MLTRAAGCAEARPSRALGCQQLPQGSSTHLRGLNVTQQALSVTQRALSVTQRALRVTQRALSVPQQALRIPRRALRVTQRALRIPPGGARACFCLLRSRLRLSTPPAALASRSSSRRCCSSRRASACTVRATPRATAVRCARIESSLWNRPPPLTELRLAKLIERCSDGVEDQGAEDVLWGRTSQEFNQVSFGKSRPTRAALPFSAPRLFG
jgi:hypothetical protein